MTSSSIGGGGSVLSSDSSSSRGSSRQQQSKATMLALIQRLKASLAVFFRTPIMFGVVLAMALRSDLHEKLARMMMSATAVQAAAVVSKEVAEQIIVTSDTNSLSILHCLMVYAPSLCVAPALPSSISSSNNGSSGSESILSSCMTPLMYACRYATPAMASLVNRLVPLLAKHIPSALTSSDPLMQGMYPLHHLAAKPQGAYLQLLTYVAIQSPFLASLVDYQGRYPFHHALLAYSMSVAGRGSSHEAALVEKYLVKLAAIYPKAILAEHIALPMNQVNALMCAQSISTSLYMQLCQVLQMTMVMMTAESSDSDCVNESVMQNTKKETAESARGRLVEQEEEKVEGGQSPQTSLLTSSSSASSSSRESEQQSPSSSEEEEETSEGGGEEDNKLMLQYADSLLLLSHAAVSADKEEGEAAGVAFAGGYHTSSSSSRSSGMTNSIGVNKKSNNQSQAKLSKKRSRSGFAQEGTPATQAVDKKQKSLL